MEITKHLPINKGHPFGNVELGILNYELFSFVIAAASPH